MSFWQTSTASEYMFYISALLRTSMTPRFFFVAPGRAKVARVPSLGRLWVAAVASFSLFVEKHRPFKINSELSFWQGIYDIECIWMCIPAGWQKKHGNIQSTCNNHLIFGYFWFKVIWDTKITKPKNGLCPFPFLNISPIKGLQTANWDAQWRIWSEKWDNLGADRQQLLTLW